MKLSWKSLISLLLVLVFVFQLFPASVLAVEAEDKVSTNEEQISDIGSVDEEESADSAEANNTFVVGEVDGLREESVKHFRMSDGSFTLVEYDTPIHFQSQDGKWEDIDNTLQKRGDQFVAENGDMTKKFSSDLSNGDILSLQYKGYSLNMSLVTALNAESEPQEIDVTPSSDTISDETSNEQGNSDMTDDAEQSAEPDQNEQQETVESNTESDDLSEAAPEQSYTSPGESNKAEDNTKNNNEPKEIVEYEKIKAVNVKATVENPKKEKKVSGKTSLAQMIDPEKTRSEVKYCKALNDADLLYQNKGYNIKESIIINVPQDSYEYSFGLNLEGLIPELQENGAVYLKGENGDTVFEIPAPYMVDSNLIRSDAAKYMLSETKDGWVLTVVADTEWLNDNERAFPVTLDPTLLLQNTATIQATYICSGRKNYNGGNADIFVGYATNSSYQMCQICAKVNNLPSIPTTCTPVSASVAFYHTAFFYSNQFGLNAIPQTEQLTVEAHNAVNPNNPINVNTVTWNSLYPSNGNGDEIVDPTVLDYKRLSSSTMGNYNSWDISPVAMGWFSNGSVNSAIVLTSPNAQSEYCIANLWEEDGLYFIVQYRNTVGLEDYYTYQEASAGRAGSIYISDFTQQVTAVHEDLSFPSEITPFTLYHVYNSSICSWEFTGLNWAGSPINSCNFGSMSLGCGWKLSAMQTVVPLTINGTSYLVYNDEDGTEHYFRYISNNTYEDEDGLRFKIVKSYESGSTVYTMTDYGSEHIWKFHNGYLISQSDSVGNTIFFAYNNNYSTLSSNWKPSSGSSAVNRLRQIVSVLKDQSLTVICSFNYNSSNNKLESITDYAGRTINFSYVTQNGKNLLSSIQDTDGAYARYLYDYSTSRLSTLYDDESKYGIDITHWWIIGGWSTNRVTEFTSGAVDGTRTNGNSFHAYRNSTQLTSYRFYGPDHVSSTPDDIVYYYVLDHYGHTICAYDTNYDKTTLVGATASSFTKNDSTSKSNNRLTGTAIMGHHVYNILKNYGGEFNGYWTITSNSFSKPVQNNSWARTGNGVLRCFSFSNSDNNYIRQEVQLKAGQYIFSGYINTSEISSFADSESGAYLAVYSSGNNNLLGKSEKITYNTLPTSSGQNQSGVDAIDEGWEKVSVAFSVPSDGQHFILSFEENGVSGSCFCDDMQLERYENIAGSVNAASNTNHVRFGGFDDETELGTLYNWDGNGFNLDDTHSPFLGKCCAHTSGSPNSPKHIKQTVNVNKSSNGLTFILSGWGKANSVGSAEKEPTGTAPYFGLIADIYYSGNNTPETHYVSFNSDYSDWQFASGIVVPKQSNATITTIDIYCAYDYNANEAYFDNISFLREPLETYYYNDDDGNLCSGANGNAKINCTYYDNSSRLHTYTTPSQVTHTFTYDNTNKLLKTEQFEHITNAYIHSTNGKVTQAKTTSSEDTKYLQSNYSYYNVETNAHNSHFLTSSTDVNELNTARHYLSDRSLDYVQYPNNTVQSYRNYTNSNRLKQTYISGKSAITYDYDFDNINGSRGLLTFISRKSFIPTNNGQQIEFHQKYSFDYHDLFGNVSAVSVSGSNTGTGNSYSAEKKLVQKSYESGINNGRLSSITYPNGDAVSFGYDMFDRITSETYTTTNGSNITIHNEYSSEGDLVKKYSQDQQGGTAEAYLYNYDSLGRLIHSREYNNGLFALQTNNYYDTSNRPKQQSWTDGTATFSQTLSYNENNDMLASINRTIKSASQTYNVNTSYSYDALLRLTETETTYGTNAIKREYSYRDISNSNRTTAQVETMNYCNSNDEVTVGAKYEYQNGNLCKVYPYNTYYNNYLSTIYQTYSYDALGQLISADDKEAGCSYAYFYDTAGNIRKMIKAPYAGNSITIELDYNDTIWRDRLTSVKVGNTTGNVVYENVGNGFISGNPISYYNGRNYSFTWQNGRQLSTTSVGNTHVSYSYDMSGLRSSKTVGSDTYYYDTINGQVVSQKCGTETLWFVYDDESKPYALIYQSGANAGTTIYFYALNLQGDVVALLNASGIAVAKYRYDPWGAVTVTTDNSEHIGELNPLRYRGYYYDSETGLYYLQSRYYDPAIGRFINADTFATTNALDFLSCNMFAYCKNNPIISIDPTGNMEYAWDRASATIQIRIDHWWEFGVYLAYVAVIVGIDNKTTGAVIDLAILTSEIPVSSVSFAMTSLYMMAKTNVDYSVGITDFIKGVSIYKYQGFAYVYFELPTSFEKILLIDPTSMVGSNARFKPKSPKSRLTAKEKQNHLYDTRIAAQYGPMSLIMETK